MAPFRRCQDISVAGVTIRADRRLGEPEEVARVAEFLADPESGDITGQVYAVDGGLYM